MMGHRNTSVPVSVSVLKRNNHVIDGECPLVRLLSVRNVPDD
jgi:hypothetical protein